MKSLHEYVIKYSVIGTEITYSLACVAYDLPDAIGMTRQQMINMGYSDDAFRMTGYIRK